MLKIQELCFSYDRNKDVLQYFSMELKKGELVALMGPSGCGKSTLLQIIAGFQSPNFGSVQCNTKKISYAFQEPRLFPWMTVEENLRTVQPHPNKEQIKDVLGMVDMIGSEALYPDELSGGMKSRISLARALLYDGDLFLLDEPFSALDQELRSSLSANIREYLKSRNASAILVTHQKEDATIFADRIITMGLS